MDAYGAFLQNIVKCRQVNISIPLKNHAFTNFKKKYCAPYGSKTFPIWFTLFMTKSQFFRLSLSLMSIMRQTKKNTENYHITIETLFCMQKVEKFSQNIKSIFSLFPLFCIRIYLLWINLSIFQVMINFEDSCTVLLLCVCVWNNIQARCRNVKASEALCACNKADNL